MLLANDLAKETEPQVQNYILLFFFSIVSAKHITRQKNPAKQHVDGTGAHRLLPEFQSPGSGLPAGWCSKRKRKELIPEGVIFRDRLSA